jgi:hypothetical protein
MVAQAVAARMEAELFEPQKAQQKDTSVIKYKDSIESKEPFQAFGNDGLTFWDFLDIVNPLQHIPVISTLYRSITGDEIDPGAKIAGGTLYGGPIGAISSLIDIAIDMSTGKDIGEHMLALVKNSAKPNRTANQTLGNKTSETRSKINYSDFSNPYLATNRTPKSSVHASTFKAEPSIIQIDVVKYQNPRHVRADHAQLLRTALVQIRPQTGPKLDVNEVGRHVLEQPPTTTLSNFGNLQNIEHVKHVAMSEKMFPGSFSIYSQNHSSPKESYLALHTRLKEVNAAYNKVNNNLASPFIRNGIDR